MTTTNDDALSAHRTRTNRRPEPPHEALVQAVEDVYRDVIEDRN